MWCKNSEKNVNVGAAYKSWPVQKKLTFLMLDFLFRLHGIPVSGYNSKLYCEWILTILRLTGLIFVNFYVGYRVYKLINQNNVTYDIFPLINAAVSACIVDSVAIHWRKFKKFSTRLCAWLHKYNIYLQSSAICSLFIFYLLFAAYVLICAVVFPIHANHWFDAGRRNDTPPDFLHRKSIQPCAHITIFVMCSGNAVSNLMLYCFVCCILHQIVKSLLEDVKNQSNSLNSLEVLQSRFLEIADIVKTSDSVFSLVGLVGLGCVFSRACACIHFYLNMTSPFEDSWLFIIVQIAFDFCALIALTGFAASIVEEGKKIPPAILQSSLAVSVRDIDFHVRCLKFAKVAMSSDIQLSAWKLFPVSRKILPTVIGMTLSYVAVIIQMHHAVSFEIINFERSLNTASQNLTDEL